MDTTHSYDEYVKDIVAEGTRHRWIRRRGDAYVLTTAQYRLPVMCVCCGTSQATQRVERDVTARSLQLTGGGHVGFQKITGRLPVCEHCCQYHAMVHQAVQQARTSVRSSQPVRRLAIQAGGVAAAWLLLVAAIGWGGRAWLVALLPAGAAGGLYGRAVSVDRQLATDLRQAVDQAIPDGWNNPAILNYPHVNLHYRTGRRRDGPTGIRFGIYLELYNPRFGEAFRASNERCILERRPC